MRKSTVINILKADLGGSGKSFLEGSQIDDIVGYLEKRVLETMLWQPSLKGHLAAFKPRPHSAAGSRILALVPTAGGSSKSGAWTATHSPPAFTLCRKWMKIMQLHYFLLKFTELFRQDEEFFQQFP